MLHSAWAQTQTLTHRYTVGIMKAGTTRLSLGDGLQKGLVFGPPVADFTARLRILG